MRKSKQVALRKSKQAMSRSSKQALIGLGAIAAVLVAIALVAAGAASKHGLRADVLSQRRAEPGEEVPITVSIRDTAGSVRSVQIDYGDGASETHPVAPDAPCREPMTEAVDFKHTYAVESTVTVEAKVTTGGCGAKAETVGAIRSIQIKPVRR